MSNINVSFYFIYLFNHSGARRRRTTTATTTDDSTQGTAGKPLLLATYLETTRSDARFLSENVSRLPKTIRITLDQVYCRAVVGTTTTTTATNDSSATSTQSLPSNRKRSVGWDQKRTKEQRSFDSTPLFGTFESVSMRRLVVRRESDRHRQTILLLRRQATADPSRWLN